MSLYILVLKGKHERVADVRLDFFKLIRCLFWILRLIDVTDRYFNLFDLFYCP